jgi:hypothetical protein
MVAGMMAGFSEAARQLAQQLAQRASQRVNRAEQKQDFTSKCLFSFLTEIENSGARYFRWRK